MELKWKNGAPTLRVNIYGSLDSNWLIIKKKKKRRKHPQMKSQPFMTSGNSYNNFSAFSEQIRTGSEGERIKRVLIIMDVSVLGSNTFLAMKTT